MLKRTANLLLRYVGTTKLTDLPPEWQAPVQDALEAAEKANPKIKAVEIKGQPHKSYDDPDDQMEVVTARLKDENDSRISSIHIHQDGSSKQKPRRK